MAEPRITFVLPFYNEADFIADTLASLAAQACGDFELVLVDNGSTDGSVAIAKAELDRSPRLRGRFVSEPSPGKTNALVAGMAVATHEFVGTLDADTFYPPDYVERLLAAFDANPDAAMVIGINTGSDQRRSQVSPSKRMQIALWPRKCHGGGCAQAFRRDALEQAGGFDPARWPFVLEDHEIVCRVREYGGIAYDPRLVCRASDRRSDRSDAHWNRLERLLYKLVPAGRESWFFDKFLRRRFAKRGLSNLQLRNQAWKAGEGSA
ncbi:glycosyltransferase family 2 protein [Alteriqipengyuania sp. WL0013]|uniref:glycosyltransferase n=1 Tax=Alteriqipengyuania sp. WL0013 TaxID=3110773 RepID=UPI002B726B68|nr:glycosyltransferase family 2 protein [Alteriqipengyuania sp. WL0013]MEB3415419.1 glycosyltransferase family 2 protein [Alteriqipengyuania sp. WL0013]